MRLHSGRASLVAVVARTAGGFHGLGLFETLMPYFQEAGGAVDRAMEACFPDPEFPNEIREIMRTLHFSREEVRPSVD